MDNLVSHIYHEKQQEGSMLCAQHALNSLLQGNYFSAPDLSDIARTLDSVEQSYDQDRETGSTNMDDTGFFSIQVLEHALNVWGLSLVRWRSEEMRPYQEFPHNRLGFVLNQNQHWYTLRRFGSPATDPTNDTGNSHWFNLNSFESTPQWVGKLYLSMFIQQAENDGYSVFVVVPLDPAAPSGVPHCVADDIASTIPESALSSSSSRSAASTSDPRAAASHGMEGFEDEDMELQAALQASLAGGSSTFPLPLTAGSFSPIQPPQLEQSAAPRAPTSPLIPPGQDPYGNADVDPVAASMARNRAIMNRMREQQEMALREQYEDETARFPLGPRPQGSQVPQSSADEGDEDDMLRRAMEESLAHHQQQDGQDDVEPEASVPRRAMTSSWGDHGIERVYDDDDAEFQAALKASLENMPEGFNIPESTTPTRPPASSEAPTSTGSTTVQSGLRPQDSDVENESDAGTIQTESEQPEPPAEAVDMEEIRRRRLARFGG